MSTVSDGLRILQLIGARPFELISFSTPPLGATDRLRMELEVEHREVEGQTGSEIIIREVEGFELADGTGLELRNLTSSNPIRQPLPVCPGQRRLPLAMTSTPAERPEYLLILGSGDLDARTTDELSFQLDRRLCVADMEAMETAEIAELRDMGATERCGKADGGDVSVLGHRIENDSRLVLTLRQPLRAGHLYHLELHPGGEHVDGAGARP